MSAHPGTREPALVRALCDLVAITLGVGEVGFAVEGRPERTSGSAAFRAMDPDTAARLLAAAFRIGREVDGAVPVAGELVCRQRFVGGRPAILFALFPDGPPDRERGDMILGAAATFAADLAERLDRCEADANARAMLRRVEEVAAVGGFAFDPETRRFCFSEEVLRIHGLSVGDAPDLDQLLALYPRPARDKLRLELDRAAEEGAGFDLTTPVETADGRRRTVRTIARARLAGKRVAEVYGTVEDVTAEIESEHRGWWAANHDPLTGLANRLLFDDRLSGAIRRARRTGEAFALVLATLSRPRGGTAAAQGAAADVTEADVADVASRIGGALRETDTLARISPHDFALLLPEVSTRAELSRPLARLGALFGEADPEVAFGAALYPRHGRSEDALMRAADVALLKARTAPGRTAVYDRSIAEGSSRRRESVLERAREALANGQFVPYYQPQVDIATSEIVGAEALVRWKTPNLVLDAKDFAFALEDQEIGGRVGKAILAQVVEDMQRLGAVGERPFRISVNASRNEVLRNDYLDTFLERVRAGHLDGSDFIIEITEDVIIGIADQKLHDRISYLASNGVEFSLDDFGTGYASLIHITSFPIKEIKVDKQFVAGIETDRRKRAIVRGIVSIARSIGLNVIAEGVETYEQEDVLRSIGCRYAQGYLYAFPMPFEEFAALVEG